MKLLVNIFEIIEKHGIVVKTEDSQTRGCGFKPRYLILGVCYVDYFSSITFLQLLNDAQSMGSGTAKKIN